MTSCWISSEDNTSSTFLIKVAKDHDLNINSGSQIFWNLIELAIDLGTWIIPRAENSFDGSEELFLRILRKSLIMLTIELLVLIDEGLVLF